MGTDVDIAGLGMTPMSLRPGATPARLACDAIVAALRDASISHADVDGLLVASSQGVRPERVGVGLAATAGLVDLRLLEHLEIKGATTLAMLQRAHYAITSGEAHTVVCVFADAPIVAGRGSGSTYAHSGGHSGTRGLERASGLLGSVPTYALLAQRWFHVMGGSAMDLCTVAVTARRWAAGNPDAVDRSPLDADSYHAAPMIAEPLRRPDCARPVNGAVAVVVTGDTALGHNRIRLRGFGRSHPVRRRRAGAESWFGGGRSAVNTALAQAGMARSDIDVVELYDPFSIVTLILLAEYGLTNDAPVGAFVQEGRIGPGGDRPVNTGGGQLAGFYLQGMTPLAEAILQLRGLGGARQVSDASTALVSGLGGRMDHHAVVVLERAA
ncbi:thiolase [Mycobacterium sp. E342]|uniref:thiolase family protein n=1 Tax=Mycobacterium sp. E342 TaxID=1834147 RepID=UPI000800D531|nr:thiolase family protein [Mycobacterium sp. E342]OBH25278.1 thiolase [Mycobacterium sp. E342]